MAITATPQLPPSPSPSPSPRWTPPISIATITVPPNQSPQQQQHHQPNSKLAVDFSPPLIAMVVVVAAAFLLITYSRLISRYLLRHMRRWQRWRRRRLRLRRYLPSSNGDDLDSPPPLFDSPEGFHVYSPYGLDESVIKTLPLFIYTTTPKMNTNSNNNKHINISSKDKDCAVCLLEFEDNDYVRTLPVCSHAFHVDCIDIWLRSHANCPLCRARICRSSSSGTSPFIPLMAARIRPSLDDSILTNHSFTSLIHTSSPPPPPLPAAAAITTSVTEITPCIDEASPRRNSNNCFYYCQSEDRFVNNNNINYNSNDGRDFLLKRSYSFGFERSLAASDRMLVTEPATASPWRYSNRRVGGGGSFWSKRPSPFGSLTKPRVFSFRYYRGMKSPFFRRRGGFFPWSERFPAVGGGGSSRRSKSMASPMFLRSSVAAFSSSRLRCGDPEALLSPERYNRR